MLDDLTGLGWVALKAVLALLLAQVCLGEGSFVPYVFILESRPPGQQLPRGSLPQGDGRCARGQSFPSTS